MAVFINIDEKLIEEAQRLGGHKTKQATVNEALQEYICRRSRLEVLNEFGTFEFDEEYDYKSNR